jgi:Family of unknown function (DUF5898)
MNGNQEEDNSDKKNDKGENGDNGITTVAEGNNVTTETGTRTHSDHSCSGDDPLSLEERLELAQRGNWTMENLTKLADNAEKEGNFRIAFEANQLVNALWKELNAELQEKKAAFQLELELSQAAFQANQLVNARLKEELELSQAAREKTIKFVYYVQQSRTSGNEIKTLRRRHPFLKLNDVVEPSSNGHKRKGCQQIEPADIVSVNIWGEPHEIPVPIFYRESNELPRFYITSFFKPQTETDPLCYDNEIEVQFHVNNLVVDAIECLGLKALLGQSMEISFYGCTPDIIVVTKNNTVILAIEVKSPERLGTKDNVFESGLVAGQLWLYLMSVKQMGVAQPLGAICTFNKIRLVSLHAPGSLEDDGIKSAQKQLLAVGENGHCVTKETIVQPGGKMDSTSPIRTEKSLSQANKRYGCDTGFQEETDAHGENIDDLGVKIKPRLHMDRVREGVDVLPALMHAIRAAYNMCREVDDTAILTLSDQEDLGGRYFPFVSPKGIGFLLTSNMLKARVTKTIPREDTKYFVLLESIGKGSNGEVYLCCSKSGTLATMKIYNYRRSFKATQDKRDEADLQSLKQISVDAKCEKDRWDILYGEGKARCVQANGSVALLMPYGQQLLTAEERHNALEIVKQELVRFAKAGYTYSNDDLRWRHCLKMDDKVMIVDLGSLTYDQTRSHEDSLSIVDAQIEELQNSMGCLP